MVETGEENGSPGLHELVAENKGDFAADVFIASDGPRVSPEMPTIFLGARGVKNFDLVLFIFNVYVISVMYYKILFY